MSESKHHWHISQNIFPPSLFIYRKMQHSSAATISRSVHLRGWSPQRCLSRAWLEWMSLSLIGLVVQGISMRVLSRHKASFDNRLPITRRKNESPLFMFTLILFPFVLFLGCVASKKCRTPFLFDSRNWHLKIVKPMVTCFLFISEKLEIWTNIEHVYDWLIKESLFSHIMYLF